MTRNERRSLVTGLIFIAPWLAGFVVFAVYPILASFYYSLCSYNVVRPPRWIGLENYIELITDDPKFYQSLYNTLYMMLLGLPIGLALAFLLALLLNAKVRDRPSSAQCSISRALYPSSRPRSSGSGY